MTERKSVLITGASTGIGQACAHYFAERGWRVYAGVRRDADARRLEAAHENIAAIFLDVTDEEQIARAARKLEDDLGEAGLQGLVNNAGIAIVGPLEFLPLARLRKQFEVNFFGQVAVTQAFLGLLRRGRGRIANVSSVGGRIAAPFLGPYSASKFALEAFTDSLRREMRHWDIHVASIEPGAIATPIWEKSYKGNEEDIRSLPPEAQERYGDLIAAGHRRSRRSEARGLPPRVVAESVYHAFTAKRPRIRYAMGPRARFVIWLTRFMPDKLLDWAIAREFSR